MAVPHRFGGEAAGSFAAEPEIGDGERVVVRDKPPCLVVVDRDRDAVGLADRAPVRVASAVGALISFCVITLLSRMFYPY